MQILYNQEYMQNNGIQKMCRADCYKTLNDM